MVSNVEVWSIGRMAAEKGLDEEAALKHYADAREITRDQDEIFRDGFANVNRDYAEDLDRAEGIR